MPKDKSLEVKFTKERDTAKTVRFEEEGDPEKHSIGKLYVKKTALKKLGDPEDLTVTLTVA